MSWNSSLTFVVTPKSGPVRQIITLLDANHALSKDLPLGYLKLPHWQHAARTVLAAAETGDADFIRVAFEALVDALDAEGWMTRAAAPPHGLPAEEPRETIPPAALAPEPARADPLPDTELLPDAPPMPDNVIPFPVRSGTPALPRVRRVRG